VPDNTRPSRRELDELAAAYSATYLNANVRGDTRAAEAVLREMRGRRASG
jgi:hypothetical protein